ncbi:MAG: thiol peroxidase [Desulfobacca sp.]|nr:thiol peroxidase [Desulfobacca sp.]
MAERPGMITFQGTPLTLVGDEVKVGDQASDVELLNNDLAPVKLSDWRDQVCIIASVPSLDTPVCDIETRRFNDEAASLGPEVPILTISMDLPFAQKRWCGASGVTRVKTLSDHRQAAFGLAYGLLIKELRLLARAVLIIDGAGTIRYMQLVKEITEEPDYDSVLRQLQKVLGK